MIVVFLGPPGCGKGTQARLLTHFKQVSTGELFRREIEEEGEFSEQLKKTLGQGCLVDDALVLKILTKKLEEFESDHVLLDGFPRRLTQAEMLDAFLKKQGKCVDQVISFCIPDSVLIERIQGRFVCSRCGECYHDTFRKTEKDGICNVCQSRDFKRRSDDSVDVLKKRLFIYQEETKPLEKYYITNYVDATLSVEELHHKICHILGIKGEVEWLV